MLLLRFFSVSWILVGLLGVILSLRLLAITSEDRGRLEAIGANGVAKILYDKLIRLAYHRLLIGAFGVFVGVVTMLQDYGPTIIWRPAGLSLSFGFLLVKATNAFVTYLDLRDRDKISHAHLKVPKLVSKES